MRQTIFLILTVLFFYKISSGQKAFGLMDTVEQSVVSKRLSSYEFETLVRLAKPYQKLPPLVQFHTSDGKNLTDKEGQDRFLFGSALPAVPAEFEWKKKHSIDEAMDIYRKYCNENRTHPYLDVYQQYYGWLLITRYDMLSDTSKQNMANVGLLIENMIEAKYTGYQLLYYSLSFLKASSPYEKTVKQFAAAIEQYGKLDTSHVNAQNYLKNPEKTGNSMMDDAFHKYYTQKLENQKGFDAIIKMK